MKNIILAICAMALTALSACDKVDEGEFIVFAGAAGQWYDDDGSDALDATQRVLVEKYTGVRCRNCPLADDVIHDALARYGSQLVALAIHPQGSNYTIPYGNEPDLSTAAGKTWNDYNGFSAYPQATLNRTGDSFVPTANFDARIDALLAATPKIGLGISCARKSGDTLDITVRVEFLTNVDEELNLTLAVSENGIATTQKMPDGSDNAGYVQNHVLRAVITDIWGAAVDKGSADGATGSRRVAHFAYRMENDGWSSENCSIVAFVSRRDNNTILNAAECAVSL
ncbi:MAG: Uncharacterized protein AUK63_1677 [bacterium P3]|nr:MAG: Uncharacterized protein AUK63_1677 [bacterium P3]KWW39054.1 MAG: Uncharacterized protein F083_2014 [bacterium F083]